MKKYLFIAMLFTLANLTFAQKEIVDYNIPKDSLVIDTVLEPIVEEFVQEALERGFYVRFLLMRKMDYIKVHYGVGTSPNDNRLGVVGVDNRGLYVTPRILDDYIKLRLTIFHEIGHILKGTGEHTCTACYDIMSEYSPPSQYMEKYKDSDFWESKLDEYFKWLNSK